MIVIKWLMISAIAAMLWYLIAWILLSLAKLIATTPLAWQAPLFALVDILFTLLGLILTLLALAGLAYLASLQVAVIGVVCLAVAWICCWHDRNLARCRERPR